MMCADLFGNININQNNNFHQFKIQQMSNYKQQKSFSASNLNFWARLLIFVFSVAALIGIKFPDTPTDLAVDITNSLSTSGLISVIGIIAISVIMPIYNFIRTKPTLTAAAVFGSPNFWIYALSFLFGVAILFGIQIPDGTAEQVVGAVYQKDWTGLFTIALTNIIDPIIRWFRDKRATQVSAG